MFGYTHALVRDLPNSFADSLCMEKPEHPIDVALAHKQHDNYVHQLKQAIQHVAEVSAEESLADCCFVEDPAVIVGSVAVISNLAAPTRRGETPAIRTALVAQGLKVVDMQGPGTLDGGDVLVTGHEIIVGLSSRTTEEGVRELAAAFVPIPVRSVSITKGLHLKSALSLLDEHTLVVADNAAGRALAADINTGTSRPYDLIFVPDAISANVLRLRDTVFIQTPFPASEPILERACEERKLSVVRLHMSELIKADSALTCCSLLW